MAATTRAMATTDTLAISRADELWSRKTGQSKMSNRTIRFPTRQQQHLVISKSRGLPNEPPVDQLGASQEQTGPRSEILVDGEAMPDAEKNIEEATIE
jgi:hypothetical protein